MGSFLRETLQALLLAIGIFLALQATVRNFRVEGSSMEPTLYHGQYLVVNKMRYLRIPIGRLLARLPFSPFPRDAVWEPFSGPRPGDVVVFHHPRDSRRDLVKRVIAGPGDTVEIRQGHVYVNGRLLHEPYVKRRENFTMPPISLGRDEYFVLGDNRPVSSDSRSWGPLPRSAIIGKAWFTYWPPSGIGLIEAVTLRRQ
jgi:signal peptidase I